MCSHETTQHSNTSVQWSFCKILRFLLQFQERGSYGPGKRGHIVVHDVSWAVQTGKHLLPTQNVSEQNQKHFLCPQQMLYARANGETFVSATMCPHLPGP